MESGADPRSSQSSPGEVHAGGACFITGALGFLGQQIAWTLGCPSAGANLVGCVQNAPSAVRLLVRTQRRLFLPLDTLPQVKFVRGELGKPETYRQSLQGVQTVIHNAALVSFKKTDKEAIFRANIQATQELLDEAAQSGCRNFIFISSISAVGLPPAGAQQGVLADETMYPDLEDKKKHDPYGYSKLVAEQLVQSYQDRMRVIILNPSVILGPGSERIDAILSPIHRWLRWAPVLPMLTTLNSFVDGRDVARAVALALQGGRSGERYIVTAWNMDMVSFTRLALKIMDRNVPVYPVAGGMLKIGDKIVSLLDWLRLNPGVRPLTAINVNKAYSNQKICTELGWSPWYTLEQSLADTLSLSSQKVGVGC
ncbi:MAG: NAD-dependent epimerase/dehydratase family protein [Anaerolineales bacterium]|nr:NAD-dependent epimerase/dehydratase family protein [Anaerolineales bacterium]